MEPLFEHLGSKFGCGDSIAFRNLAAKRRWIDDLGAVEHNKKMFIPGAFCTGANYYELKDARALYNRLMGSRLHDTTCTALLALKNPRAAGEYHEQHQAHFYEHVLPQLLEDTSSPLLEPAAKAWMRGGSRRGHFAFTALAETLMELAGCGVFPLCSCHLQGHITATPLLWSTSTATMIPLKPASQDPAARPQMTIFSCREYDLQSVPFWIGHLIPPGRSWSVLVGRLSSKSLDWL